MLEGIGKLTIAFVVLGITLLIAPAFGALCGAAGATVVAWWFPTTMGLLSAKTGLTVWQLGAACGFFGGYLARGTTSSSSD